MNKKKDYYFMLMVSLIITLFIIIFNFKLKADIEEINKKYDLSQNTNEVIVLNKPDIKIISNVQPEVLESKPEPIESDNIESEKEYSKYSDEDKYNLAKIAMAEAEGESIKTKMLIIAVILNRVESSDFPDSILEVIFENNGKTYQFSPVMQGGRWWSTEPNSDCYKAVEMVLESEINSQGALYFESCTGDSWHNKNLTYLYQSGNIKFYK